MSEGICWLLELVVWCRIFFWYQHGVKVAHYFANSKYHSNSWLENSVVVFYLLEGKKAGNSLGKMLTGWEGLCLIYYFNCLMVLRECLIKVHGEVFKGGKIIIGKHYIQPLVFLLTHKNTKIKLKDWMMSSEAFPLCKQCTRVKRSSPENNSDVGTL